MKADQDTIYYLAGDDVEALRHSPQLEGFRARGFEVLLLSDPVDSFWPDRLGDFEGKKLRQRDAGEHRAAGAAGAGG